MTLNLTCVLPDYLVCVLYMIYMCGVGENCVKKYVDLIGFHAACLEYVVDTV